MTHFTLIVCAQAALIMAGLLLVLSAFCQLVKVAPTNLPAEGGGSVQPALAKDAPERERASADLTVSRPNLDRLSSRPVAYQRELCGVMEDVPEGVPAGQLARTAKVIFKYSLRPVKVRG